MSVFTWITKLREARWRILDEDALKHLHASEWNGRIGTMESLAGALGLSPRRTVKLCERLESMGSIRSVAGGFRLTPAGEEIALQVIRAHRLWERYLADEARMPMKRLHAEADRREHRRPPGKIQELDASMGYPQRDPHGDPIPTAEGKLPPSLAHPLIQWPIDEPAVIVHLEDEPEAIFSQIAAEGLRPGQRIRIIEADDTRIVFTDDFQTHILAPVVAGNIFVVAAKPADAVPALDRLTSLKPGGSAVVYKLDEALQGFTRRRLLDLGLTPGVEITAEYQSFLGDPMAFRVRGSLVALRCQQARHILIQTKDVEGESRHG